MLGTTVAELEVCVFVLVPRALPSTGFDGIPPTISDIVDAHAIAAPDVLDLTTNWSILPLPLLVIEPIF